MADAAAARREARRRKILENSQNRLQLISGKKGSDECASGSHSLISKPELSYEFPGSSSTDIIFEQPMNNGVLESESPTIISDHQNAVAAGDTELTNEFQTLLSPSTDTMKGSSTWEKLMSYKYDVALLAIFNQLLYGLFSYESAYFFLPLIVYTATRIVWFPVETKSSIANAVLLMNGLSANNVQAILRITKYLAEISQDIFVYLFVTICTQVLFIVIKEKI